MTSKPKTFSQLWHLLKKTVRHWLDDDIGTHAASLAYYAVFSMAPTLIIAMAIAGTLFGAEAARGEVRAQLQRFIGDTGAKAIEDLVTSASKPGQGLIASVVGLCVLIFAATGVFTALQNALNLIWRAPKPNISGVLAWLKSRALSLVMVLGIGILLLASLLVSALITAVGDLLGGGLSGLGWHIVDFVVSFGFATILFSMIYKLLPNVRVSWGDVWLGAAATAAMFNIGNLVIGLYLGRGTVASSYGASGSFAVLLIWVYYSSMVLFFGAELTHVYAVEHGSRTGLTGHKSGAPPSHL